MKKIVSKYGTFIVPNVLNQEIRDVLAKAIRVHRVSGQPINISDAGWSYGLEISVGQLDFGPLETWYASYEDYDDFDEDTLNEYFC